MKPLTIIKIGGAVITQKSRHVPILRRKVLKGLAKDFNSYLKVHPQESFVLIHGVGSFGHPLAKRYALANIKMKQKNILGVGLTHHAIQKLSIAITQAFLETGSPIIQVSPASCIIQNKGRISFFAKNIITSFLKQNLVPLLHGDIVNDEFSQFSVCSGDQIISYLTTIFPCKRVIFLTDVDGVFSNDPKTDPHAKLIKKIQKKKLTETIDSTRPSLRTDVTNSMKGKLSEIIHIPCPVQVLNGLRKNKLLKALKGEKIGTEII